MGRFYFHVVEGAELLNDVEGLDLRDALEARQVAIRSAREILADAIRGGKNRVPQAFVITDEQGRAIETVPFAATQSGPVPDMLDTPKRPTIRLQPKGCAPVSHSLPCCM
jgi:hypothetical protein